MSAYHTITDASGRSIADHAARLGHTLDSIASRVREAIAEGVGTAVDGAVRAAVRAALSEMIGTPSADRMDPVPGYARAPSYWDEEREYSWGRRYGDPFEPPPVEPVAHDVIDHKPRRWAALILVGGRLLTQWLRHRPMIRPGWRTVVCAGLVTVLAVAAGAPAAGLARSALGLTALAAGLRAGGGLVGSLIP